MNRNVLLFCIIFAFLCGVFGLFNRQVFFPSDILRSLPMYAGDIGWERVENSLLADPVFQFEPWRHYAKERLLQGEFPFINDRNALGSPFFANQISALFYPLTIFYYILPVTVSLFVINILKIVLLFLFSFLYFRSLSIRTVISYLGAFAVSFSAFPLVWLHWPQTNVYILFPLLLFITEKIRSNPQDAKKWNSVMALVYFVAILGGHPETLFHIGIIHSLYILFRIRYVKQISISLFYIFLGFLLAGFALIPFVEYLFYSYMLLYRLEEPLAFFLPLTSIVLNGLPFLFGAPHLLLYKPVWNGTNFQEVIGGYTGVIFVLFGLVSLFKLNKHHVIIFWSLVCLITAGISYAVFPFDLVNSLPVFNTSANHRFIASTGFSLIVLSLLFIEKLITRNVSIYSNVWIRIVSVFFVFSSLLFLMLPSIPDSLGTQIVYFGDMVKVHIVLISISTVLFIYVLHRYIQTRSVVYAIGMFIAVFLQTGFLFFTYNSITPLSIYYPETSLTRAFKSLPEGVYIEIGNPSLPENINLMYGLSSIDNYDALEIASFRSEVDNMLGVRNQWGNREEISQAALNHLGISYVVADYDARFEKKDVVAQRDRVLDPLYGDQIIQIPFTGIEDIRAFRLLPATFNRKNSCELVLSLYNQTTVLSSKHITCSEFLNNMYYTVEFPQPDLNPEELYHVEITSNAKKSDSAVSFYGDGVYPYLGIVTDSKKLPLIKQVHKGETWQLFMNPYAQFATNTGTYQVKAQEEEYIALYVDQQRDGVLELKRASYPGWTVKVDGVEVGRNHSPFLSVSLPKGVYFVEFIYVPYSFYLGLIISGASFAFLLLWMRKDIYNGLIHRNEKK